MLREKIKLYFQHALGYNQETQIVNRSDVEKISLGNPREDMPSSIAMIYRSEFDYISRCILDYRNIETGGQLFGYWTSTGIPVVLYAIGPGKKANHQETFFNQDLDYLETVGNFLLEKYGLQHIGEWHSHHQLGLAQPSGHDASTMVNNISRLHLRRFLLCIGNCTEQASSLNAFSFHEDHDYDYVKARWSIKECESPFRPLVDKALDGVLVHPRTGKACHGKVYSVENHPNSSVVNEYENGYWLNERENRKVLANIYAFLKEFERVPTTISLNEKRHVQIAVGNKFLYFPPGFPQKPFEFSIDRVAAGDEKLWNFQGDILEAFKQYYVAVARMGQKSNNEVK